MMKKILKLSILGIISVCMLFVTSYKIEARGADITEINPIRSVTNTIKSPIISRKDWGCPDYNKDSPYYCDSPYWYAFRNPVSHIVLHHTATSEVATDWNKEMNYVWTLQATIRDSDPNDGVQGWTDVGYNYIVDQDGKTYEGRYGGEGATGGHVGGHNIGTVGISLLGNYETLKVTDPQYQSLKKLLIELHTKYKIDPEEYAYDYSGGYAQRLSKHEDWNATACPGKNAINIFDQLRKEVAQEVKKNWKYELESSLCPTGYLNENDTCKKITVESEFTTELNNPTVVLKSSNDELYISGYGNNYLYKISNNNIEKLSGSFLVSEIIKNAVDMEIDEENRLLYVLNSVSQRLVVLDLDTMESVKFYTTGNSPKDILKMNNGIIYIANAASDSLTKIDTNKEEQETIELEGEYPISLSKDVEENLYITFYLSDAITKITNKGKVEHYTSAGLLPTVTLPNEDKSFYVLNEGDGKLMYIDELEVLHTFANLPYQANSMLKLEDGSILTKHPYNNSISKVDPQGYVSTITNIGKKPFKLFQHKNKIYFLDKEQSGIHEIRFSNTDTLPLTKPVYRFWSPSKSSHFFTGALNEKKEVINKFTDDIWTYENVSLFALQEENENALAVHRFWSGKYESHFYTISENEKNEIIEKFDEHTWKYEGIAYYAYPQEEENTSPVFRFWSGKNQAHFYTMSEKEKNEIIEKFDEHTWKYEGVAYFAYAKD